MQAQMAAVNSASIRRRSDMLIPCELMTICMIVDKQLQKVLIQRRTKKNWAGVAFPGGHVEPGEGFGESIIREVYEETGLTISNIKLLGTVHWEYSPTGERSIIMCYGTECFSGELIKICNEGINEWIPLSELRNQKLAPYLEEQLAVFEKEAVSELFYLHDDEKVEPPRVI